MTSGDVLDLLQFLGSRYAQARRELDEIRVRALELVVAACVSESRERPPGEMPPPSPSSAPVLSEEAALREEPPPVVPAEPGPEPEPEAPVPPESPQERGPAVDREPEVEHQTGPLVWPPAGGEDVPEEPVRGSWDPPDNR
jgi:hypothetical protein